MDVIFLNPYVEVVKIIAFASLFAAARILGKQTVSRMTIFNLIAVVTLGSVTANLAFAIEIETRYIFIVL
jgi:uncharacterized membrane protein YcaP (DUF421 family)